MEGGQEQQPCSQLSTYPRRSCSFIRTITGSRLQAFISLTCDLSDVLSGTPNPPKHPQPHYLYRTPLFHSCTIRGCGGKEREKKYARLLLHESPTCRQVQKNNNNKKKVIAPHARKCCGCYKGVPGRKKKPCQLQHITYTSATLESLRDGTGLSV